MSTREATAAPVTGVRPEPGLFEQLASHASRTRYDDVPEAVQRQAKLCILDTIGCIVAGSGVEDTRLMLKCERARNARPEASVLGANTKLSIEAAVRVNAYAGDIFELNDLIGGHASIANVTAALALAEATQASGRALLEAVIAGIETTTRVYSAYYPSLKPYTETGMTPPGFPNTIGVAAGAAKLLGLDENKTANALAVAGALAGWCPAEVIFGDGGTVKPMMFGAWPGTVGILGAMYAKEGISGPARLLESKIGFFATASRRSDQEQTKVDFDTWHLSKPRRKLHACCGYIHAALDAVVALRKKGVEFEHAAEVRVGMPEYIIPAVSKDRQPISANEARFHAQFCLALAAREADVIEPKHSIEYDVYMRRADIRALMNKFKIVPESGLSHYHHCSMSVIGRSGTVVERGGCMSPKGAPGNPMSDEEVRAKFRRLAGNELSATQIVKYLEKLDALERSRDCGWLVTSFD